MAATVERISDRTRGTGYKVRLPEVGDRFTVRICRSTETRSLGISDKCNGCGPLAPRWKRIAASSPFEEAEWDSRAEYPSHAERYIITGWRVTATAPRQSALLWTTVSLDESGFSTDPAP